MSEQSLLSVVNSQPVPFAKSFVTSDAFRAMFREGMGLVETTAIYLDGQGRTEAKALPREVSLTYASESMRLTTRLMQVASWLLLQRAVAEGELSPDQAKAEKHRVRLSDSMMMTAPDMVDRLPETLRGLIAQSQHLQSRILLLERQIDAPAVDEVPSVNPLAGQMSLLNAAFSHRR
jgi:regulator of CtrA degradation